MIQLPRVQGRRALRASSMDMPATSMFRRATPSSMQGCLSDGGMSSIRKAADSPGGSGGAAGGSQGVHEPGARTKSKLIFATKPEKRRVLSDEGSQSATAAGSGQAQANHHGLGRTNVPELLRLVLIRSTTSEESFRTIP